MAVGGQIPDRGAPLVRLLDADFLGQVHALESRESARQLQRTGFTDVVTGHDATVLRTLLA